MHGGATSTGPKTEEGKRGAAEAGLVGLSAALGERNMKARLEGSNRPFTVIRRCCRMVCYQIYMRVFSHSRGTKALGRWLGDIECGLLAPTLHIPVGFELRNQAQFFLLQVTL